MFEYISRSILTQLLSSARLVCVFDTMVSTGITLPYEWTDAGWVHANTISASGNIHIVESLPYKVEKAKEISNGQFTSYFCNALRTSPSIRLSELVQVIQSESDTYATGLRIKLSASRKTMFATQVFN
jgi:hypothetical protein